MSFSQGQKFDLANFFNSAKLKSEDFNFGSFNVNKFREPYVGIINERKNSGWFSNKTELSLGSGIIISEDGKVVTARHVVKYSNTSYCGKPTVLVYTDKKNYMATVENVGKGIDDYAVLQIIAEMNTKNNKYISIGGN